MNNLELNFTRPVVSVLTEALPNGEERYFIAENAVKIDGPFWFLSHLIKRAAEYGVEL